MRLQFLPKAMLLASMAIIGLSACQKQEKSETHDSVVIKTQISSPVTLAAGGTSNITIIATCDWTIEADEWITVEPASGTKGFSESTLTVTTNTTGEPRLGTLRLSAGSYSGTVTFTQGK